ncbi:Alpha/Beta hydrolase protein, partial [Zopfochytrium polystomum]
MSYAAYEDDPAAFLARKAAAWPHANAKLGTVRCGDRSKDSPLSPYVLAVTTTQGGCCWERGHARDERTVWVAFRGTDNYQDVLTDLTIVQGQTPIGMVHRGFLDRVTALLKHLQSIVEWAAAQNAGIEPGTPLVRLFFTGHSLGGAMAQVALLQVWQRGFLGVGKHEHVGVISFGSPLVGNRHVAEKLVELGLNDRVLNVVSLKDIVPVL